MILWLAGAFVLGPMKLMASVMANDSGSASADAHLGMIAAVMGGKKMTLIFLAMLLGGVAIQAGALYSFFS